MVTQETRDAQEGRKASGSPFLCSFQMFAYLCHPVGKEADVTSCHFSHLSCCPRLLTSSYQTLLQFSTWREALFQPAFGCLCFPFSLRGKQRFSNGGGGSISPQGCVLAFPSLPGRPCPDTPFGSSLSILFLSRAFIAPDMLLCLFPWLPVALQLESGLLTALILT